MATGFHLWSKTAATNASVDSSINMAEGMAPSAVNDGIRAAMARLAEWRDDLGGIATGGSATAYTVATNRVFASAAVMAGAIITIIPHATSGASPTLAVDGLTARQIRYATGVNVPTGALTLGTPYAVVYVHASTEFILLGAPGVLSPLVGPCPVGSILDYGGTAAPTGWLLCFGQSLVRTDYAALFAVLGTTYGAADGTHFSLPDCRGRVVAGQDDMGGSSANRLTDLTDGLNGDTLGAVGGLETQTLLTGHLPSHTHTGTTASDGAHTHTTDTPGGPASGANKGTPTNVANTLPESWASSSNGAHTHTFTTAATGSDSPHNNVQPTIILNKIIFAGI